MRLSLISLVLSVLSLLGARAQTSLPGVIHTGPQQSFHVQGVVVDVKHQCVYYSFTTSLLKTDLQGNVIGSVQIYADGKMTGEYELKAAESAEYAEVSEEQEKSIWEKISDFIFG